MTPTMPELGVAAGLLAGVLLVTRTPWSPGVARRGPGRVLEERLAQSQREVAELARAVAGLSRAVESVAPRRDGGAGPRHHHARRGRRRRRAGRRWDSPSPSPRSVPSPAAAVVEVLEEQAVSRLAEVDTSRPWGARLADAGVKALALGHGVRRALSEENRDRAAAEAHVARRRSRRTRRQELREARRLLRALRSQQAQQQPSARTAEDAA